MGYFTVFRLRKHKNYNKKQKNYMKKKKFPQKYNIIYSPYIQHLKDFMFLRNFSFYFHLFSEILCYFLLTSMGYLGISRLRKQKYYENIIKCYHKKQKIFRKNIIL